MVLSLTFLCQIELSFHEFKSLSRQLNLFWGLLLRDASFAAIYIQLEYRISIIISCGFDIITSSCEFMLVPSYCWPVIYYKVFSEWDKLLIASNITLAASLIEEYFCPSIVIWVSEFRCPMAWINCILYSFEIIILY